MAESVTRTPRTKLWLMRAVFVLLGLAVILFSLMPLETTPRRWTGPDLLLVLACVWTLRRPDYAPALAIGLLMLLADLMFQRPPGLMAALVVLACEWLKGQARTMRDLPFLAEWAAAAGAMTAVIIGYRVILAIFLAPLPPLTLSLIQLVASILAYPLVVLFCIAFFGLKKRAPGAMDGLGGRA
ncbi:rod shape-determining protein MreD [Pseudooceanicola sp. LIPI14-2-Ac024]|uniref:rod shape-determining protein MreD n=1 Tax=Pseudooceanicola sp. LIPI14-2-Ac024 TaxID=3344875 RepID=UPI0035D0394B